MDLDEYLNRRSIEALQRLLLQWAPDHPLTNSKVMLLRDLRQAMLSEKAVASAFARLTQPHKRHLRALLQNPGYQATVEHLVLQIGGGREALHRTETVIEELADRGFVETLRAGDPGHRYVDEAFIPQELGTTLIRVIQMESRSLGQIVSLARYLGSLSKEERRERAAKALDDPTPPTDPTELAQRLADSGFLESRLPELGPLREPVEAALRLFGGLAPVPDLDSLGLSAERNTLGDWRQVMEDNLIGTVGNTELYPYGLDQGGEHLVVYLELARHFLAHDTLPEEPQPQIDPTGVDFFTDVDVLLNVVGESEIRLLKAGALFRGSERRLSEELVQSEAAFFDPEALVQLKINLCVVRGLLELDENAILRLGPLADWWQSRELLERIRFFLEFIAQSERGFRRRSTGPTLGRCFLDELAQSQPGAWYGFRNFPLRTIIRFLLEQVKEPEEPPGPPPGADRIELPETISTLAELADRLAGSLSPVLQAMGVIGIAGPKDRLVAVRLTPLGAAAVGAPGASLPDSGDHKQIIVNPDFEVILFREGPTDQLLFELSRFAERERSDQTHHLKITRQSVQTAAARGMTADRMLEILSTHARTPIPQNVAYSIRSWPESVTVTPGPRIHLLEADDPEALKQAFELPAVHDQVSRRASPTTLVLRERPVDKETLTALRRLGVHLW